MEYTVLGFIGLVIISVAAYTFFPNERQKVYAGIAIAWFMFVSLLVLLRKGESELEKIEDDFNSEKPQSSSVVSERANKLIKRLRAKRNSSR